MVTFETKFDYLTSVEVKPRAGDSTGGQVLVLHVADPGPFPSSSGQFLAGMIPEQTKNKP